ncbi:MAG: DNA mismatch repair protein MutS [Lachnospiraceae bacterium]|nr:DNA mismatch repair protein MutS [Lachnospiraceae bacterium]
MAEFTPMMMQYLETKEQYKDCILFYRLGDFYEMFFEDAVTVSRELELTLTGKSCGQEERAPMCGIPYHAVDGYLNRLIGKGYRVAICEQVEDPKAAKGLVKREVTRIVTPGTNLNTQTMDESKNNYLMGVTYFDECYGISTVDVTTGDYYVTQVEELRQAMDEIIKFMPSEIIYNPALEMSGMELEDLRNRLGIAMTPLADWYFDGEICEKELKQHFKVGTLDGLGLKDFDIGTIAAGAVLRYLYETQKNSLSHITRLLTYLPGKYMVIDSSTRRNLELTETLREKQKRGSLLWVLDKTKTAMGARMLRSFMEQPLIKKQEIEERLDAIEELNQHVITREEMREYLDAIYDLERLMGRVSYKTANPRDLIALMNSLQMLPHIRILLQELGAAEWKQILGDMDPLQDIEGLIQAAIDPEPPLTIKEGGIIKTGYNEEVDRLRLAKTEGKNWLANLEAEERERTGIKNLKVKFNRVFGYYLEVTNSYKDLVPQEWIRKQTLANAERYTTPELKKMEEDILGAEDKLFSLEYDLFTELRDKIAGEVLRIQQTAKAVAKADAYVSLALVAERNRYVRPAINENGVIRIRNGRHPVVEQMIPNDMFVENDTLLDNDKNRVSIITGPNMAGKSTYMRQTALIVLMAQVGSFVPAESAEIGIVDRIFTRVGASDDLASGQSTFMVEMTEVANILRNATRNSLLILDEIGRGTSTYDGLSIAWAVVEHIADAKKLGAKTLFATHYHELTELEGRLNSVNNYCIAVKEQGEDIIFLRKIIKGGADKSYGIQVAKLAGVPEDVLKRAYQIADQLAQNDINTSSVLGQTDAARPKAADTVEEQAADKEKLHGKAQEEETEEKKPAKKVSQGKNYLPGQLSLFAEPEEDYSEVIAALRSVEISRMTPLEALNRLYALQEMLK